MKTLQNITKYLLAFTLLLNLNSCMDDDAKFEFVANTPTEGLTITNTFLSQYVLTNETIGNLAERFVWTPVDYGTGIISNYELQGSPTSDFTAITTLGITTNTELGITVSQLMSLAGQAGLDNNPDNNEIVDGEPVPNNLGDLYFRLKASTGTQGENELFSAIQTITVFLPEPTGDTEIPLPRIGVPGNHQGWSPESAPELSASSLTTTDYEGYIWLDGEYKFIAPNDAGQYSWGNTDWGDDGTFSGTLVEQDETNCIAPAAGYYLVKANTGDLTYSVEATTWGLIGSATPGGWDNSTSMTYDSGSRTLSVTLDLIGGEFYKFRANNAWDINLGDDGNNLSLEYGGADIPVADSGNYTVILDLSNPRAYTYSITLN